MEKDAKRFEVNDRVIFTGGRFQGEHGKIDSVVGRKTYGVTLDIVKSGGSQVVVTSKYLEKEDIK